jgi:hypothetical protein
MNSLSDNLIDNILSEYRKDERLHFVLQRLKIDPPNGSNWPAELRDLGLFEIEGAPDYLKFTPFGKAVKAKGGWVKYKLGEARDEIERRKQSQLDREIKELTRQQLELSIWQIKGWWWLLLLSLLSALIASNFELILRLLGIL